MRAAEATGFPSLTDLNRLPSRDFADAIALLFGPAPRFAAWLAGARPFKSDGMMLEAAARIAHRMTETEQVELINAHPRLGSRDSLSSASRREQGAKANRVDAELARLNDAYEARFGFRYLVYVAGRPRADLPPELRAALKRERDVEIRRALDDSLAIAADRLQWFRSPGPEGA